MSMQAVRHALRRGTSSSSHMSKLVVRGYTDFSVDVNTTHSITLEPPVTPSHSSMEAHADSTSASGSGPSNKGSAQTSDVDQRRLESIHQRMSQSARRTVERRKQLAQDRQHFSRMGSINDILEESKPSYIRRHSPSPTSLTLTTLVSTGAHLGHHKSSTSIAQYPYIYGTRGDISILDLRHTITQLRRASNVIRETVEQDGIILFLRGIEGSEVSIECAAKRIGGQNGFAITRKWIAGSLTNKLMVMSTARSAITQSQDNEQNEDHNHEAAPSSSNESSDQKKRMKKKDLEALKFEPSLIIVPSPHLNRAAMREAALRNIPTIGITDSDVDPRVFTYPILANDDSVRTVELIVGVLARAGREGFEERERKVARWKTISERNTKRFPYRSQSYTNEDSL